MAGAIFGGGPCRRAPAAVYASGTDLTNRGRHGDLDTLPSPQIMPVIRPASAPNGRRHGGFDKLSAF